MVQVNLDIAAPIDYVEALRDYGWKIKFQHLRPLSSPNDFVPLGQIRLFGAQEQILPYGGITICSAKKEVNGSMIEIRAEAHCNKTDKYVKKIGTFLSSQRLWEYVHDDS